MVLIEKDDEGSEESEESVEDHGNYDCSMNGAFDESKSEWPSDTSISLDCSTLSRLPY